MEGWMGEDNIQVCKCINGWTEGQTEKWMDRQYVTC